MADVTTDTLIVINARDNASRTMKQVGRTAGNVGKQVEGVTAGLSKFTGVISGLGIGALVGLGSIDSVVNSIKEWRTRTLDFEAAQRRANTQIGLAGFSTDLFNEKVSILERTLGRTATTAILQNAEATQQLAEVSNDAAAAAATLAKEAFAVFRPEGVTLAQLQAAAVKAVREEYDDFNEALGLAISNQKELEALDLQLGIDFEKLSPSLIKTFENIAKDILGVFSPIMGEALKDWDEDLEGLKTAWKATTDAIGRNWDPDSPLAGTIKNLMTTELPKLWAEGSLLRGSWQETINHFAGLWSAVSVSAVNIFASIRRRVWGPGTLFQKSWESTIGFMSDLVPFIGATFTAVFKTLKDKLWDTPSSLLRGSFSSFVDWILRQIKKIPFIDRFISSSSVGGGSSFVASSRSQSTSSQPLTVNVIVDGQIIKSISTQAVNEVFVNAGLGPGAFAPGV